MNLHEFCYTVERDGAVDNGLPMQLEPSVTNSSSRGTFCLQNTYTDTHYSMLLLPDGTPILAATSKSGSSGRFQVILLGRRKRSPSPGPSCAKYTGVSNAT